MPIVKAVGRAATPQQNPGGTGFPVRCRSPVARAHFTQRTAAHRRCWRLAAARLTPPRARESERDSKVQTETQAGAFRGFASARSAHTALCDDEPAPADQVLLPEYGGQKIELKDEEYHLFREDDILGIMD